MSSRAGALAAEIRRYLGTDVRAILPSIRVPTLVFTDLDAKGEATPGAGRFLAARIPDARLVEQSSGRANGGWHWYTRADGIVAETGSFLTGIREEEASFDRVLATVLFTDIVGSTDRAAVMGDGPWRDVLERHHATCAACSLGTGGREIDTAGDGFFATFDGPARAVRCASAIASAVRPLGVEIRAGLHTGEVEHVDGTVRGIAVHIGARVMSEAGPSEVLASSTVRDLVTGSGWSSRTPGNTC